MAETTTIRVTHGSTVRSVVCAAGMDAEELRIILSLVSGHKVVGLESETGVLSPLSLVCSAPSFFAGTFRLVVAEDVGDFKLDEFDVRELCSVFWRDGGMDDADFARAVEALVAGKKNPDKARAIFRRVWRLLPDVPTLLAGLSTLVDADSHLRLGETFALFDANGDGVIALDEMVRYFYAVFVVTREKDPSAFSQIDLDDLALATAKDCFAAADANHDGVVSFDEFKSWFTGRVVLAEACFLDLPSFHDVFHALSEKGSRLDSKAFVACCADLGARPELATAIFDLFDGDLVAAHELAAGLSVLSPAVSSLDFYLGSPVSKTALMAYLTSFFRVACPLFFGEDPETRAAATAQRVFRDLGDAFDCQRFEEWWHVTLDIPEQNLLPALRKLATFRPLPADPETLAAAVAKRAPPAMTPDRFKKWYAVLAFCEFFDASERSTKLQVAASAARLHDLDAAAAMTALAPAADRRGNVTKSDFVARLAPLLAEGASSPALGDVFDVVRSTTSLAVATNVPASHVRKLAPYF